MSLKYLAGNRKSVHGQQAGTLNDEEYPNKNKDYWKIISYFFMTNFTQRCAFERIRADSNTISGLRILNLLSQSKTVKRSVTFYEERRGGLKTLLFNKAGSDKKLKFLTL